MSSLLYALAGWANRARILVLCAWIAVLALLGAGAVFLSQGTNAPITIPGTESQQAIDTLSRTFPEVSGTSATIIVVAPEGERVDDPAYEQRIVESAEELEELDSVAAVSTPFSELAPSELSDDGRAALITVQLDASVNTVPAATEEAIPDLTAELRDALPAGAEASYGGELYSTSIPGFTITEAIGVVVAFIVLVLTLGSLVAAGMPLIIALLGVGISVAGIYFSTAFLDMTSTTPMLALMLGLAVGIDYTLFIVSRHQEQLRAGVPVDESIARATATSGSAVVFAGLTVIIALVGLSVAGIPFLTALGVAAAAAVAVAVLIAVTLTPAILGMAGIRILPRKQRRALSAQDPESETGSAPRSSTRAERFFVGWVRAVTAKPIITVLVVLIGLGAAALPAFGLRLALPGAETLEADNPARVTYELTGEHFGEGANGPLLLTGSIIHSTDPLGLMDDLADEVRAIPGVADVPLATPNQGADTGIIQVIPDEGPQAQSTADLVAELRSHHDEWVEEYGVSLAVTGFTAVGIDVSQLLFEALIPFGILVVGLSLVLLAMVFRSVWVPIKATLGYLLSVGAAFGAVVAVFQWGWFAEPLHVHHAGPVLSFMPIILMGVLFGLAMDYEVFLVSRIREEVVHGADSRAAIRRGFVGSARVVTAAAIIMFAVFAAFVPEGDPSIKVIALGLAVGVFVDAFIVRMILVPAVLQLLGDQAWWMPRWLDRLLPSFDVEGEGLARELEFANWPPDAPDASIAGSRITLPGGISVPELRVAPEAALLLDPADPASLPLAGVLSGRGPVKTGTLKVRGLLLPERASSLRSRAAWATPSTLAETLEDEPELLVLDLRSTGAATGTLHAAEQAWANRELLTERAELASRGEATPVTVVALGLAESAAAALPPGTALVRPGRLLETIGAER
ncbi:MMPL family transporter [Leucobacter weissii]|uniref:MMPL family transporter n=1 Tax=Leucobacter weissii TaxID=1983706 RepID=A0A939MTF2_9MICO|nr:MMPL family transporter [Leucobacter weissii]MBO1902659.1 MMPL family transporter [Leucobacter weissii]